MYFTQPSFLNVYCTNIVTSNLMKKKFSSSFLPLLREKTEEKDRIRTMYQGLEHHRGQTDSDVITACQNWGRSLTVCQV